MLKRLAISNYALIDRLEMEFGLGMTIITGETGAGKSILLGALSLLLGARADTRVVGDPERKSVVEALFCNVDTEVNALVADAGIDLDPEGLIVRREISAGGRSRTFINDTPVTLTVLSRVASRLVDIHSQHANLLISDPALQMRIIDSYGSLEPLLAEYRKTFRDYARMHGEMKRLRTRLEQARQQQAELNEQLALLKKLKPVRGEQKELERRVEILSDAGDLRESLATASSLLGMADTSALALLDDARAALRNVNFSLIETGDADPENSIPHRLDALTIELKDLSRTLSDLASDYADDPALLAKCEQRLQDLTETAKRFRLPDADALVDKQQEIARALSSITSDDEALTTLEADLRELGKQLRSAAMRLSEARENAARRFSAKLEETAKPLGLANLKFEVQVEKGKIGPDGQDKVVFCCAFNLNQPLMPMTSVASGGEISRLMLSLKSVMSARNNLPTIIFDEVDTGVSGEIADLMGEMMLSMGADMQVIAITHLPQVAAKGQAHFKVFKTDAADKTITRVELLDAERRVREIAAMMSGSKVNDAAIANARALMGLK